jgi:subtilisin-like proprotein convertase family protein
MTEYYNSSGAGSWNRLENQEPDVVGKDPTGTSKATQNSWLLSLFMAVACLFMAGNDGVAQTNISNYTYSVTTGATYTPITGTVVASGAYDNEISAAIPMGASFTYGGTSYSTCFISANGFITFGTAPGSTVYTPLSTTASSVLGVISAFGQDAGGSTVAGATPSISYLNTGAEFVVQYADHANYFNRASERLNFQIRLTFATGAINIIYGTSTNPGTSTSGSTVQVGLRGNTTTYASNINSLYVGNVPTSTTCDWSNAVSSFSNASTMLFTAGTNVNVKIPTGLQYTWTPGAQLPVRTFQATTAITSSGATLSWTAPTGATAYNVQYRVPGTCTWTNWPGNPVATNTLALTGLSSLTVYQARVQAIGSTQSIYSHIPNAAGTGDGYTATGTFTTLAACPGVATAMSTSVITTTTATISWTAASPVPSNGYQYEVRTSGAAGSGATGLVLTGTAAGTTANLVGLTADTSYSYYVRTFCGGTDYGSWTAAANFRTSCLSEAAPTAIQTFATFTGSAPNPACWSEATGAVAAPSILTFTNGKWFNSSGFGNTGTNVGAKLNLYGTNAGDWLISQPIDLGATPGLYRVSYNMAVTSYNGTVAQPTLGTHIVRIIVSTDGGATWSSANTIRTYTGAGSYSNTGQIEKISLTGYSGVVKIAFVATTASTSPDIDFHIDDFSIEVIPSCAAPTALSTSLVTNNSATISWAASVTPPDLGYDYFVSTSATAPLAGTTPTGNTTSLSVNLTSLLATTQYYYWVRSNCTAGDQSAWASGGTFTTQLVVPTPYFEGFASTAQPAGWGNTGMVYGSSTGAGGNPGNTIYKNLYSSAPTGNFSTVNIGPVMAGQNLYFDYRLANFSSPYGPAASGSGNFVVQISTDFGSTYTTLETVVNDGVAGWRTKVYSLSSFIGQNIKVRITGNWTSGDYYLAFDNFAVIAPCSGTPDAGTATAAAASFCNTTSTTTISAAGYTTAPGITYQWQFSTDGSNYTDIGTASATYSNLTTAAITQTTHYRLKVVCNGGGTGFTATPATVTVFTPAVLNNPTATPGTICSGESVDLAVSGAVSYAWTSSPAGFTSTSPTPTVTPAVTTTYSVVGTDSNGCPTAPKQVVVTVNQTPTAVTVSSNPTSPVCEGTLVTLSAAGGNVTTSSVFTSPTVNSPIPDNDATGVTQNISVSGIPVGAIISKIEVTFDITHPFDGDVEVNLQAPNGKIVNLVADRGGSDDNFTNTTVTSDPSAPSFSTGSAPFTGVFTADLTAESNLKANGTFGSNYTSTFADLYSIANGLWKVTAYDDASSDVGTLNSSSIRIYYSAPATIVWTATAGTLFTSVNPDVAYVAGTNAIQLFAKPTSTATYTANAANGSCAATPGSTTVTVNPLPVITLPSSVTICKGTGSNIIIPEPNNTYSWAPATGVTTNSVGDYILNPATTTTYTVTTTNTSTFCQSTREITVNVNDPGTISSQPTNKVVATGFGTSFTVAGSFGTGYYTYQWQRKTGPITFENLANNSNYSGVNGPVLSVSLAGTGTAVNGATYRCLLTPPSPCAALISNMVVLTVSDTGIASSPATVSICLPTPSTTQFSVITNGDEPYLVEWQVSTNNGVSYNTISLIDVDDTFLYMGPNTTAIPGLTFGHPADLSHETESNFKVLNVSGINSPAFHNLKFRAIVNEVFQSGIATLNVGSPILFTQNLSTTPVNVCKVTTTTNLNFTTTGSVSAIVWKYAASPAGPWNNVTNATPVGATYVGSTTNNLAVTTTAATPVGVYYYQAFLTGVSACPEAMTNVAAISVGQPVISIASSATTYCAPNGAAVQLTASGAGTSGSYLWSTTQSGSVISVTPSANTNYSVTGTDANGCTNTASTTVNAGESFSVVATASSASICEGGAVTLNATATPASGPTYLVNSTPYNFVATTGTFTPLTDAINTSVATTADSAMSSAFTPGMTFNFGGTNYTSFRASSDGFLVFGGTSTSNTGANNLTTTTSTYRPGLAPLWDDLQCTQGVKYKLEGTAPNRVLTVEWLNMEWNYASPSSAPVISFQVKLYETTNVIEYVYRQEAAPYNTGSSGASIGLMGTAATNFVSLQNSSANPAISTSVSINNIETKPATGQIYRFTPTTPVTFTYTWTGVGLTPSAIVQNPSTPALNADTTYSVTVTSNAGCTATASTTVSVTPTPVVTGTNNGQPSATRCGVGMVTLTATGSPNTQLNWFAGSNGGTPLFTGSSFETPVISATTPYYVEATTGSTISAGRTNPASTSNDWWSNYGLVFNTTSEITLNSVVVYPFNTTPANMTIRLLNSAGTQVAGTSDVVFMPISASGATPQTVSLGYTIPVGSNYKLVILSGMGSANKLVQETSGITYPITTGPVSITSNWQSGSTSSTNYNWFYNWNVSTGCTSPTRTLVNAVVTPAPALALSSSSSAICVGQSTGTVNITPATVGNYTTYTWSPSATVTGNSTNGYVFTPTVSTVYTLTATEAGGCAAVATYTVTVNSLPPAITIIPSGSTTICDSGSAVLLTVSGGASAYCIPTVTSSDGTDFINNFSYGGIVNNSTGQASSQYRYYSSLTANVVAGVSTPLSIQSGSGSAQQFGIWIDMNQNGVFETNEFVALTTSSTTAVVNVNLTIPTTALNGLTRMRVASKYSSAVVSTTSCANTGYGEYEDYNVNITGGVNPVSYIWSSANGGLFTDAVGTVYNGTTPRATIYAKPTASGIVTVTGTNASNCSTSATINFIVNPVPTATIAGTVAVCQNAASPVVTFTGANGTAPYTFTYKLGAAGSNQTIVSNANGIATITVSTAAVGLFDYILVSVQDASSTTCSQLQGGNAAVTVNPLPTATMSANASTVCQNGTSPIVTFTGANGTAPYTFTYTLNGVAKSVTSTGTTATVAVPSGVAGTFVYTLAGVQDASSTACYQVQTGAATVVVHPTPVLSTNLSNQLYYSGFPTAAIPLSGTPSGVLFNITGGAASGLADQELVSGIPSFTPTATGSTVTVTPVANGCFGTSKTYQIAFNQIPVNIVSNHCGSVNNGLNNQIQATSVTVPGYTVTGYSFLVTNLATGQTATVNTVQSHFKLTDTDIYTYGTTYSIRVAVILNGNIQGYYGNTCNLTTASVQTTKVINSQCGATLSAINSSINADVVNSTNLYRFRVALASAPTTYYQVERTVPNFNLTMVPGLPVLFDNVYNVDVQVRVKIAGFEAWSQYGQMCTVKTPKEPTTSIILSQCDDAQATSYAQVFNATPVTSPVPTKYRFLLTGYDNDTGDLNYSQYVDNTSPSYTLGQFTGLTPSTLYVVEVAMEFYGVFTSYGKPCTVITPVSARTAEVSFSASAYPNPFADNFKISVKSSNDGAIDIKVYDMVGRIVEQRTAGFNEMDAVTIGDRYPSGVYNVIVTQNEDVKTLRVIKR